MLTTADDDDEETPRALGINEFISNKEILSRRNVSLSWYCY